MAAELPLRGAYPPAPESRTALPEAPSTVWVDADGRSILREGTTAVMGILNVTPDSFSDGGLYADPGRAEEAAWRMREEGADIIDIGGMSARPGAAEIPVEDEWTRIAPILQRIGGRAEFLLSVDTYRAEIAERALDAGATIVNDISGFTFDSQMPALCARTRAPVVLMHTTGKPDVMMDRARYTDVCTDVMRFLDEALARAVAAGVAPERIVLDPGFGFGKTPEQGWTLLARLEELNALGRPLLIGVSRKSMFKPLLGDTPPHERDPAGAAAATAAVLAGARIVRTHNVAPTRQSVAVADQILASRRA